MLFSSPAGRQRNTCSILSSQRHKKQSAQIYVWAVSHTLLFYLCFSSVKKVLTENMLACPLSCYCIPALLLALLIPAYISYSCITILVTAFLTRRGRKRWEVLHLLMFEKRNCLSEFMKTIRMCMGTGDGAVRNARSSEWGSQVKLHRKSYMHISPWMGVIP